MKKNYTIKKTLYRQLLYICLSLPFIAFSLQEEQQTFDQFQGKVLDSDTGKELVFATLAVEGSNISTITNTEGEFLLKVPSNIGEATITFSFLGYTNKNVLLSSLKPEGNRIELKPSALLLSEVNINVPKDARALVREVLSKKGDNYFDESTLMTAFYRETIKKRRRNVSLSEAVVNIYKTPYFNKRKDAMQLYKARKSTDYEKLDTIALKLQGGPFNTLYVDVVKYPQFMFPENNLDNYKFNFSRSTRIDDKLIYVISFKQKPTITDPLYRGELFIDIEAKTLTSAIYDLNITDRELASKLFVRRKPSKVDVWPTKVAYRVDYRNKDGKWYYGYSNCFLEFKVDWEDKLFNSTYSMTAEMAITDWEKNLDEMPKNRERLRSSIILADEASGFSDPDFWGDYNIIEPEKSIESAIKKIQRQLKRAKRRGEAIP